MGVSAASILKQLLRKENLEPRQPPQTNAVIQTILTYLEAGRNRKATSVLFAFPEPFPYSLYALFFRLCSSYGAIVEARKVDSHLLAFSRNPPIFLLNRAIESYAKCHCLRDAHELFDEMPRRDGGTWNALITAYSQLGFPNQVFSLFLCITRSGVCPSEVTFASVLASCGAVSQLLLSKQVHGLVTKFGFCGNVILGSSLVDVYAKCGVMIDARRMFHEIPQPNAVTWNVIVRRYLDAGDAREAVFMFSRMFSTAVQPMNFTFSNALVACSSLSALQEGMQIHGVVVKLGLQDDNVISSSLVNMYVKCDKLEDGSRVFDLLGSRDLVSWTSIVSAYAKSGKTLEARKLFDKMPERNVISWNAMLAGYVRCFEWSEALDFVYLMRNEIKYVDHVTLGLMLNVSAGISDHETGKQIHGYIYRHGFHLDIRVSNALLDMYGKCGNLNSAKIWFNQMSKWRDRVSWNALLASYGHHQLSEQGFLQVLARTFQSCSSIREGRQLHVAFLKSGILNYSVTVANRLLQLYTRCGFFRDASRLFDEMPNTNPFSWNTLVQAHLNSGHTQSALHLFNAMPHKTHFSWNMVVSSFAKSGHLELAHSLFNAMPSKNNLVWNSIIHSYSRHGHPGKALLLFKSMNSDPAQIIYRDAFVLATVLGACAELLALNCGKQVHARVFVDGLGLELDKVLCSSLINLYGKCGDLDGAAHVMSSVREVDEFSLSALIFGYANAGRMREARRVFDSKIDPCVVLWNSIISGYVSNGEETEAVNLFLAMLRNGVRGDVSTVANVLSAGSGLLVVELVRQMHAYGCKAGATHDVVVASALLDAYSKCQSPCEACKLFSELKAYDTILLNTMITVYSNCGRIEDAKWIFNTMPTKTLISWNSILVGLTQNASPSEALDVFCQMNKLDLKMDKFSFASVISACGSKSSLELGEQVFGKAITIGLDSDEIISTSLVDFYCKCGFVKIGRKVFDRMVKTDEVSWNTMLMGYAANGCGNEALTLFSEMRYCGFRPSAITFTGVLSACDHCGLVEEGRYLFHTMKHNYYIDPGSEHYSCMVDLFARAGYFEEAMDLMEEMPFQADANMWLSVLRGCIAHGNKIIGKTAAEQIIQLDPENAGAYIQLSNILASSGDWEGSALVRELMRDKHVQKIPGCSWADC